MALHSWLPEELDHATVWSVRPGHEGSSQVAARAFEALMQSRRSSELPKGVLGF